MGNIKTSLQLDSEVLAEFDKIAEQNNRSRQKHLEYLMKQVIAEHRAAELARSLQDQGQSNLEASQQLKEQGRKKK